MSRLAGHGADWVVKGGYLKYEITFKV